MALRVYNTLTRQKEPFPKRPGEAVSVYVCGPTVYKPSHIGHMVGPVIFDAVKRYLTHLGFRVTWVVNITDVDDKLIARARELKTTVKELAGRMTADYAANLKALNVTGVDHMPRATDHIPGMIAMMERLIAKGYAYPAGGDVYFDIAKDVDYGKLCNRDPEQLEAGSRIEVSDRKRNPGDFALWKGAKPDEPADVQFDSPWGKGRPGWHIECSVMSQALLGNTIDIHGGGLDLQFPHHENELAQSESDTDQPFARVWMHNGLLKMGTAKMAGSVGNVVNMVDLLGRHHPETVRFLLLSTHYRSPIEYSDDRLGEVARALQGFYRFFERYERITGSSFYQLPLNPSDTGRNLQGEKSYPDFLIEDFHACMEDDFNTGGAIGVLFKHLNVLNNFADANVPENGIPEPDALRTFDAMVKTFKQESHILGLFWTPFEKSKGDDALAGKLTALAAELGVAASDGIDAAMAAFVQARADARKAKNFALGDAIRKRLGELGVTLEDRPGGKTDWRVG